MATLVLTDKDESRFWCKIQKAGKDDCWNWIAFTDKEGYGRFGKHQKSILAHRVAYQLENGIDPGDLLVLHSCDNPACCNPNHLFLGTYLDNNRDRAIKGRSYSPAGEKSGLAKLTQKEVNEIRRLYANGGISQRALSESFRVSQAHIQRIIARKVWN